MTVANVSFVPRRPSTEPRGYEFLSRAKRVLLWAQGTTDNTFSPSPLGMYSPEPRPHFSFLETIQAQNR